MSCKDAKTRPMGKVMKRSALVVAKEQGVENIMI
jgi:hypothetical protein